MQPLPHHTRPAPAEGRRLPATRPTQHHWRLALQALAAEVVSLEERCLHLRSSELRAAREAEGAAEVRHRSEHRSLMTAQEVASLEATIQALRVSMLAPCSSTEPAGGNCRKTAACRCRAHIKGPADGAQEPDASPRHGSWRTGTRAVPLLQVPGGHQLGGRLLQPGLPPSLRAHL